MDYGSNQYRGMGESREPHGSQRDWQSIHEDDMTAGSRDLLMALWRWHRPQLERLAEQGLQVVRP
jgi:hypothetical protein